MFAPALQNGVNIVLNLTPSQNNDSEAYFTEKCLGSSSILFAVLRHACTYNACQKSWSTAANFALFCDFSLSPSEHAVCGKKLGWQDDPRLCWNVGTITFEINIVLGVRGYLNLIPDYKEMA